MSLQSSSFQICAPKVSTRLSLGFCPQIEIIICCGFYLFVWSSFHIFPSISNHTAESSHVCVLDQWNRSQLCLGCRCISFVVVNLLTSSIVQPFPPIITNVVRQGAMETRASSLIKSCYTSATVNFQEIKKSVFLRHSSKWMLLP